MNSAQTRGLVIGLLLGIVWMWLGFGAALLTAVLGGVGWLVGAAISNLSSRNLSFADLWNDLQGRRTAS